MALGPLPSAQDRKLEIGGQVFTLRFSYGAIVFLQDLWGLNDPEQVKAKVEAEGDQVTVLTDLLLACLQTYHKDLSQGDAFQIIDALGPLPAQKAVMEAVVAALPRPPEGEDPQP